MKLKSFYLTNYMFRLNVLQMKLNQKNKKISFFLKASVSELNDQEFVFLFLLQKCQLPKLTDFPLNIELKLSTELTRLQSKIKNKVMKGGG